MRRQRRDDVVRLPTLELEVAVAERLHDRAEVRELLGEEIRSRPAVGLVVAGDLEPLGGPRVPCDGYSLRLVVREELEQHVREAEQGIGGEAFGGGELLGQGEERPVGEVVAVDEEQLSVPNGDVVEL